MIYAIVHPRQAVWEHEPAAPTWWIADGSDALRHFDTFRPPQMPSYVSRRSRGGRLWLYEARLPDGWRIVQIAGDPRTGWLAAESWRELSVATGASVSCLIEQLAAWAPDLERRLHARQNNAAKRHLHRMALAERGMT